MKRTQRVVLTVVLCAVMAGFMWGQQPGPQQSAQQPQGMQVAPEPPAPSLKVGDLAPALAGGKWLKGEPVEKLEPGKIYVVEFWATWCGPCVDAIPHVSELQEKFAKDNVVFIGQNVWENDQAAVEPFVTKMGEKMNYRVRMDDVSDKSRGKMAATWMEAAGQGGIPCSFLIGKDAKIAWIGHPMELESVLKDVVAGTFDPAKLEAQKQEMERAGKELEAALEKNDFDGALKVLDTYEQKRPDMAGKLSYVRFTLLLQKKDYDNAYKAAAKFGEAMNDTPEALHQVARTIVAAPGIEKRDLDLAEKFAARAVELTKREEPVALETLAQVHFEKGQTDKAIEVMTEAVGKADAADKAEMQQTLEQFKKAKVEKALKPQ